MLPKNYRLNSTEIPKVIKNGKTLNYENFYIRYLKEMDIKFPLFAISISKKIDKRSTVRNRIKRIVRVWLVKNINQFEPGKYVVVIRSLFDKI